MIQKRIRYTNFYAKNIKQQEYKVSFLTKMVALYLFFAPLDFLQIIPGVSLPRFLIFLPLAGGVLYIINAKVRFDKYFVLLVVYLLVIALSMSYTVLYKPTQERVVTIALNIAVILILSMFCYNEHELNVIKKAIVLSGWFTAILMMVYADMNLMKGRLTVIANGNYQDPNYLCGFLIYPIVHYWKSFLHDKKKRCLVYNALFLVLIFMTGSRGGLVAVGVTSLFYFAIWIKTTGVKGSSVVKIIFLFCVIVLFIIIVYTFLPESIRSRMSLDFTIKDRGANRFDIWQRALYCYERSPLTAKMFGWGAGTIRYFLGNEVAHNIWIESPIEIGIVGTASLLILYCTFFLQAIKMKEYVVVSCFFAYLVMTMSLSLYSYKPIWNILLLIMLLKNALINKKNNNAEHV